MRTPRAFSGAEPAYSDHLVLTSDSPRNNKSFDFFKNDWSLAWLNFIAQECGPVILSTPQTFTATHLRRCRFLYILGNVRGRLSGGLKQQVKKFLDNGGVVIADGLGSSDLGCGGTSLGTGIPRLSKITGIQEGLIPAETEKKLKSMPFATRGWEVKAAREALTLFSMDGKSVLVKEAVGRGWLFTFGFDLGLLLTGLQQGTPKKGRRKLEKTFGTQKKVIEPEDLVQDQSLLDNRVPWADLLEKTVWQSFTAQIPAPRWWYFPFSYSGAVLSTHDEEALGDDARLHAMNAEEKALGVRSTFFIISDKNIETRWAQEKKVLQSWQKGTGPEVGLHWNRFQRPLFKICSRKFGMHEAPLKEQTDELARRTGEPVRLNRNHYLALGTHYGEHFTQLEKAGILYDSTYGPNQGGRGYLFGTGYPFWGMDGKGRLTRVLELPFQTQELWGQADQAFLEQLLAESVSQYHQCVTLLFHPHYMVLQEEGRMVWLETLALARKEGHWLPDMGQFFDFFVKRAASALKSRWDRNRLVVQGHSENSESAIALPLQSAGRKLQSVHGQGIPLDCREISNAGCKEVLVRIPQKVFEIEAVYG